MDDQDGKREIVVVCGITILAHVPLLLLPLTPLLLMLLLVAAFLRLPALFVWTEGVSFALSGCSRVCSELFPSTASFLVAQTFSVWSTGGETADWETEELEGEELMRVTAAVLVTADFPFTRPSEAFSSQASAGVRSPFNGTRGRPEAK